MASQQQRTLDPAQAKKLSDKLVGTNYKLVLVQDSDVNSEEGNTSLGPLNTTQPQPASGLPPYTLPILYIGSRPAGTPGKAPPKGFHVGDILGLTREEYGLLGDITKTALRETPGINTNLSMTHQRRAVDGAISLLVKMLPEFEVYKDDRYWPLECMVYVKLKSFKESFNRRSRSIRLARELMKTDALNRDKALVKKQQLAKARGKASAKARAQTRNQAPAPVQVDAVLEAEAQVEANNSDSNASKPQENKGTDDMEAITHEISSMSIFVPDNADSTMVAEEDDFKGPFLPPLLSDPPPSARESQTPAPGPLPAPAGSDPSLDTMQALRALLADRAELQPGLKLLLSVLDANSGLPNLQLLTELLTAIPDTTSPAASHSTPPVPTSASAPRPRMRPPPPPFCAPAEPNMAPTSAPAATDPPVPNEATPAPNPPVVTAAGAGVRRSSTFLTINELEPGPTTLQVDDSDDDTLSDISVSAVNPNQQDEGAKDGRSQPAGGRGRGDGSSGKRGGGRGAAKNAGDGGKARGNGRGRGGRGRGRGQSNLDDASNSEATTVRNAGGRATRSKKLI